MILRFLKNNGKNFKMTVKNMICRHFYGEGFFKKKTRSHPAQNLQITYKSNGKQRTVVSWNDPFPNPIRRFAPHMALALTGIR